MIQDKLKAIGLSEHEISVYISVLESAEISPSEIAKKTGLSRPSVYAIGKQLAKKGLILEENRSSGLRFLASPPEALVREVESEKRETEARLALAKALIPELDLIPKSQTYSVPRVRFIEESLINDYLYQRTPDWDKSGLGRDATWWGVQDSSLIKQYPEWLVWYWKQADPLLQSKMITNEKEEGHSFEGQDSFKRSMHYWNKGGNIRMTQAIFGDYVLILNTHTRPHSLFEIYDAVTAEGLRQVFRGIWETL
jgi:DNA-binding MarR family transcriptional regulator